MSISRFQFCAIPDSYWQGVVSGVDIARFARDALACERRIAKEINLENEHPRYTLLCQQLEREVKQCQRIHLIQGQDQFVSALQVGEFPTQNAEPGYLALLSRGDESDLKWRFGSGVFPPDAVADHIDQFQAWVADQGVIDLPAVNQRLDFFNWAVAANCGVLELQSSFHPFTAVTDDALKWSFLKVSSDVDETQYVSIPEFALSGVDVQYFGTKGRKQHSAKLLREQIQAALQTGEPVSFGNTAPHDVITQVLHGFVFVPSGEDLHPASLRIMYADGSEANPFPLFCLPEPAFSHVSDASPLRVALMSMRHLEMDPQIDYCWFRNREVSRTRTLAETDQFCYDTTLEQLDDSLALGDFVLNLFHTGFEPAVIGFYRGLVHKLVNLRSSPSKKALSVTPYYFRGENNPYEAGSCWQ